MLRIFTSLKKMDWVLFSSVFLLVCFGLAEIYSVSLGRGGLDLLNFKKQLVACAIGFFLLFLFAFWDYYSLRNYSLYIYIGSILLLAAVLFWGAEIRGTRGWFVLGRFSFQPVELIKFSTILFLARYFSGVSVKINSLRHLLITGGGVMALCSLVLLQPDFGSALLIIALWMSVILFAGFDKKYFIVIILIFSIAMAGGWVFLFKDYQKERILTFFNPSFDPLKQGYNVAQAIIAVGAGGLVGRGIGFGSQSQLKFLPESQNDFIFAVVAEELGFLGVSLLFVFFLIFYIRSLLTLNKINNNFASFFILGVVNLIFIEMFINIGMNIGLLPVVGISLPFVSYGGSSIVVKLMMVGVVESIIIRSK